MTFGSSIVISKRKTVLLAISKCTSLDCSSSGELAGFLAHGVNIAFYPMP
ncbi:hypothetical protein [Phascolarctobacterium faecium]